MNIKNSFFTLIVLSLILFVNSYCAVQEFSQYSTDITISNNNTLDISKKISLKNTHTVGFIPGIVEFNVGNEDLKLEVLSITSVDSYGNQIKHRVRSENNSKIVELNIEYPVLPGFEYTFYLNYTLLYEPRGIFFKNIKIPTSLSSIPLQKGDLTISIPENSYFTYVESKNNLTKIDKKKIEIDLNSAEIEVVHFEYSKIPLTFFNIKGSLLFWGLINFMLIFILLKVIKSEIDRYREEEEEE